MDEVLVQFFDELIKRYNNIYNKNLTINDITEWKLPDGFKEIYESKGFFSSLKPFPGAIKTIQKSSNKYVCYIITNPSGNGNIMKEKMTWIQKYMPEFPLDNVIMAAHKELINGKNSILIDDSPFYLSSWDGITVCIDRPYNNGYGDYRVFNNDFDEVEKIIKQLK